MQDKSEMEIALEYIEAHPELVDRVEGDAFTAFFTWPEDVIRQYEATIKYLQISFQFTDEMIKESCMDYLAGACTFVANLKAKEAQN